MKGAAQVGKPLGGMFGVGGKGSPRAEQWLTIRTAMFISGVRNFSARSKRMGHRPRTASMWEVKCNQDITVAA